MTCILAIDTAIDGCGIAAVRDGKILFMHRKPMQREQTEYLHPAILQQMQKANLAFEALSAVAVTIGPGSFTGIRVGMAAAKGIAVACDIPLIGCTTLEILAAQSMAAPESDFAVAVDSKRGDFFVQEFDPMLNPVSDVEIWDKEAVASHTQIFTDTIIDPAIMALYAMKKFTEGDFDTAPQPFYGRDAQASVAKNIRTVKTDHGK